jgi:hypothetical protein
MNWPWSRKPRVKVEDPLAKETDTQIQQLEKRLQAIRVNRDVISRRWSDTERSN